MSKTPINDFLNLNAGGHRKPSASSLDRVVSQRDGLEIAIIGLASVYPEDALKVFTADEITAMGKRHEHLADYECFELLKAALTNDKVERPRQ